LRFSSCGDDSTETRRTNRKNPQTSESSEIEHFRVETVIKRVLAICREHAHFSQSLKPHRQSTNAFTLLELMLAVAIVLIIMLIAIPSMQGLRAERALRESYERFEALVYKAQKNAISQQRTWVLVWDSGAILLQPDSPTAEERESGAAEGGDTMSIGEDESFTIQRPAALLPAKEVPGEWPFWRSGACEPVTIAYEGPTGIWTAQFHPLTGKGELIDEKPR
jgi:prepilin-type N-terminal cleavage/methylation domain-containing protein